MDFDLTILCPLILFASVVLLISVRAYFPSRKDCKAAAERIKGEFRTKEEGEELLEWGRGRCKEMREAKDFIWLSGIALLILCPIMLMADSWKVFTAYWLWSALSVASTVSFIVTIPVAWHYAKKSDWLRFGVCLLVMLMAAASTEHFFHQKINARHVTCPHCSDDDDQRDDN